MKNKIKDLIRTLLQFLKLDLTKNLEYDRLTKEIIAQHLKKDSVAIDIGCHKGEILDLFIRYAPNKKHYAFEPIPEMYNQLLEKYAKHAIVFPFALADEEGTTTFNHVKNAPAYSGIKKRSYAVAMPDIEEIKVELKKLDSVIPQNEKIDLIKIDVEGAELGVLKGAINTILKNKPLVIFECGLGASDFYDTKPETVYGFLVDECRMQIYLLKGWLNNSKPLSLSEFVMIYNKNSDYYFVAGVK